ncbi:MAG: DUF4197 domain-containing protein [Saprospiraceae bacterium]|nr:DUF4197 domain-containing protein [Saprospiraceae bacterium]
MKKVFFLALAIISLGLVACAELQKAAQTALETSTALTSEDIGRGLKEALNIGISKGADQLSLKDGYFKSAYKILLPPEARKVTDKLRVIPGYENFENIILEKVNRGAEDAAIKAKPIFMQAIREMTFTDAINILMGDKNAATQYLQRKTTDNLYNAFLPVINQSLNKFNAITYWGDAVNTYNKIPLVQKINPKLDDYVTKEALKGLFAMVEKEERNIRANKISRTTDLLRRVFAKQDK